MNWTDEFSGTFSIYDQLTNVTVTCKSGEKVNFTASGTIYDNTRVNSSNRYNTNLDNDTDPDATLLKTTLDFTIFNENFQDSFENIEITFYESFGDDPVCVFWNEDDKEWSSTGCELVSHDDGTTVCHCDHLTNFGLIFGYGSKDCGNYDSKDQLSQILGGISIALLVFTQVYLHLGKYVYKIDTMTKD